jgi:imidazolonepropionase-like amidohydrolase
MKLARVLGVSLFLAVVNITMAETIVLRGGTVHPVSGPAIGNASVVVVNGKVESVGHSVKIPSGAKILDIRGLHVYPGMIDSGSPIGLSEVAAERVSVDTDEIGVFNPQLRALVAVNPSSEHIPVTRANGITTVLALPAAAISVNATENGVSGSMLAGYASLMNLDGWTWEEMEVNRAAAMLMRLPRIFVSIPSSATGGGQSRTPRATYTQARQWTEVQMRRLEELFEGARRYQTAKAAGGTGFEPDVKFEAMLPVLEGKVPVLVPAQREREILSAIEFATKQNIKLVLVDVRKPGKAIEKMKEKNIPVILGPTLELPLDEDDPYDTVFSLPAVLHKAGIRFSFATFGTQFARNLPYQAANAVAFGLPYEEALKAVTLNAAEILGVGDQLGSIEPGKVANLIVTDGDPLETRTQIKQLLIRGKSVSLETKHTLLYEKYRNRQ